MTTTAAVRAELLNVRGPATARRAELAVALRFACAAVLTTTTSVTEVAVLDAAASCPESAARLVDLAGEVVDLQATVRPRGPAAESGAAGVIVRFGGRVAELARRTRLCDRRGHWVRGLPPPVVHGPAPVQAAAWRAAFLAAGTCVPRGGGTLEVTSPALEASVALIGAARRIGVTATATHDYATVVISEPRDVRAMLSRIGAPAAARNWPPEPAAHEGSAPLTGSFVRANHDRTVEAAAATTSRIREMLTGPPEKVSAIPEHLLAAGRLRMQHPDASLHELGQLADPPATKDTIAGRLRRLLAFTEEST